MVRVAPQAVVVTGASTGIGEASALRLDRAGFAVFAGVRKEADAEALRARASDRLTPVMLEVTRQRDIERAVGVVGEAVGETGLAGLKDRLARRRGVPPDEVARVVVHALTAARPKTRYVVGRGARLKIMVWRALPDRLRDWLIARQLPAL